MKPFAWFGAKRKAARDRHHEAPASRETPAVSTPGPLHADTGAPDTAVRPAESLQAKKPPPPRGLLPGSDGEHRLQCEYGSEERAHGFYTRQVLDYLSPTMQAFIARQEILFVATADRHGECDCTSKFGRPGFIRVLDEKYLIYPEYRGNGVFANLGNITENPHIAMLILDLYRDTIGLHVNGRARIVTNEELLACRDDLPNDVMDEIGLEGKKRPERWVMVEVEEAYIQCSKHIPLMKKLDKRVDWGTDNVVAKGGDYFRLQEIPLYDRIGGDKAMEVLVDDFYRRVLKDDFVGRFFEDVDMEAQRLKQKSFLAMAFGGPYPYSGKDLRSVHKRLIDELGLTDAHFDRVLQHFRDTVIAAQLPEPEVNGLCEILEGFRDDVMNR
ncbi:globin domain-containing protein [Methylotetracoccus oryzae]|uniref:globin domain-containing protein n=1 Tax=Methylotetracoccus oryzae TaxID=1919059 RepID=UPI0011181F88|nr:pyridoxamine 5'-phosphate oxidase family protein [Methylotetracoccus oryzae]